MSLETKGTIKFDPDVKPTDPEYVIQVKQLGISAEGSGNVEQMMDELSERVRREMSEQFEGATVTPGIKDDEVIVQFAGHEPIKIDQAKLALAQKTLEVSKKTGIPPDKLIDMAKKKSKGKGAGE